MSFVVPLNNIERSQGPRSGWWPWVHHLLRMIDRSLLCCCLTMAWCKHLFISNITEGDGEQWSQRTTSCTPHRKHLEGKMSANFYTKEIINEMRYKSPNLTKYHAPVFCKISSAIVCIMSLGVSSQLHVAASSWILVKLWATRKQKIYNHTLNFQVKYPEQLYTFEIH